MPVNASLMCLLNSEHPSQLRIVPSLGNNCLKISRSWIRMLFYMLLIWLRTTPQLSFSTHRENHMDSWWKCFGKHFRTLRVLLISDTLVLKLLKSLHRLVESGKYWGCTFWDHLEEKLRRQSIIADLSFIFRNCRKRIKGLFATYVDDTRHAENKAFSENYLQTKHKFKYSIREWNNTKLAVLELK